MFWCLGLVSWGLLGSLGGWLISGRDVCFSYLGRWMFVLEFAWCFWFLWAFGIGFECWMFGIVVMGLCFSGLFGRVGSLVSAGGLAHDEPESLILAQSERWRHA